ncbi:methyltransferase [Streptomyces durmitorensis]|uniref:Ribosomal RNA large subunit methyltransferase G n=1 Tax=Streptomyces durmitorensis TaxID=319947 RepID=A0ABY4Q248_9ACTN|nr:methyltransferase [Streptomyces durmitorensis]UQT60233.1 methyltransferase [Streptomyces durmitorensis]
MNRLSTSWGAYDLTRFPEDSRDPLRAWSAADAYLLRHLAGETEDGAKPVDLSGSVAVVGDRWGALTTSLAEYGPTLITDSFLAREATRANVARAGFAPDAVRLATTDDAAPSRIDVLLVRVPKSLSLLEDQLHRLAPALHAGTVVVGTGMVNEIHTSTLDLFERIIGPTRTSLARQKARLIFSTPDPEREPGAGPWPRSYVLDADSGAGSGLTVVNHAGVFCADRLDIGTRFFLHHLPTGRGAAHIVDLGCGNGVLGTAAAVADPEATVTFIDESYPAVASAKATFRANATASTRAEFVAGDALSTVPDGTVDLVLNNPPFHSHQATSGATAWRMFNGARAALRPGGELWVVGNRHLGYHVKLRKLFGNSQVVASDPKFVVLRAVKRDR